MFKYKNKEAARLLDLPYSTPLPPNIDPSLVLDSLDSESKNEALLDCISDEIRDGNRWNFRWMGLISVVTVMLSGVLSYEV